MKGLTITLATLLLVALAGWTSPKSTRYAFTSSSTLWVTGTSTVHDWQCDASEIDGWVDAEVGETLTAILKTEISVKAAGLECKNGTMNKKTHKALDADANPTISYKLTNAEIVPGTAKAFTVKTTGQMTIAGKSRTVTANVKGEVLANGQIRLAGELPITMSDYGIDPPTAMLGALKTGDDVTVHFEAFAEPTTGM